MGDDTRNESFYSILDCNRGMTAEEIHGWYKAVAKIHHPDTRQASMEPEQLEKFTQYFARITEAHAVLRDKIRRTQYDQLIDLLGDTCPDCYGKGYRLKAQGFRAAKQSQRVSCGTCLATGRINRNPAQCPEQTSRRL